jgi:hypothetical protein
MTYELPTICPVCHEKFIVKQLGCDNCNSVLEGNFELNKLSRLPSEMQQFVITFLRCRGNIREMEKILEISYPTVRARIDEIVAALAPATGVGPQVGVNAAKPTRLEILTLLANGEIDIEDAREMLGGSIK